MAAAFVLGPELIARWIIGFVVPRRSLSRNRGEEITRAVLWSLIPLLIALFWVKTFHTFRYWGSWRDLTTAGSGLYSTSFFDAHQSDVFLSLPRVAGMCWSLLWRLYLVVALSALILNAAILRYRRLRNSLHTEWMKAALATLILPRVSEWHIMLSDMLLPTADVYLEVDVLTKDAVLYQGRVQDRMLDSDGNLRSLTLAGSKRFRREDFKTAKANDASVSAESYWRAIPGEMFVIMGTEIANINIRYPTRLTRPPLQSGDLTTEERQAIRDLLSKVMAPTGKTDYSSGSDQVSR